MTTLCLFQIAMLAVASVSASGKIGVTGQAQENTHAKND